MRMGHASTHVKAVMIWIEEQELSSDLAVHRDALVLQGAGGKADCFPQS